MAPSAREKQAQPVETQSRQLLPLTVAQCRTLQQAHETAECPACGRHMRLWAGFYRCSACGFKESCCF